MKIILKNGVELFPILAQGGKKVVQGASRDTLYFVFSAETSLDELDSIFTAANCEAITVVDGENEYVHRGYAIRDVLKREPALVSQATESSDAVYENRVTISMSQRTYAETQMAEMQAALATLAGMEV